MGLFNLQFWDVQLVISILGSIHSGDLIPKGGEKDQDIVKWHHVFIVKSYMNRSNN